MVIDAQIAILSFFASWTWIIGFCFINYEILSMPILFVAAVSVFLHFLLYSKSNKSVANANDFLQVAWRAYFLGFVFSVGISLSLHTSKPYVTAGLYCIILSVFHFGEYLATAFFNPTELKVDAFIINHSLEYNAALLVSWLEHAAWMYVFPELKSSFSIMYLGLLGCIVGDCFRKFAMYTAGTNFNHVVQYYKRDDHILVTTGVYSLVRHPSYTGWFCWSVSTQVGLVVAVSLLFVKILLCNPICFIGYVLASWKFFRDRIEYEELTLLSFFGDQYLEYKKNVPCGVPFVYGYQLEKT